MDPAAGDPLSWATHPACRPHRKKRRDWPTLSQVQELLDRKRFKKKAAVKVRAIVATLTFGPTVIPPTKVTCHANEDYLYKLRMPPWGWACVVDWLWWRRVHYLGPEKLFRVQRGNMRPMDDRFIRRALFNHQVFDLSMPVGFTSAALTRVRFPRVETHTIEDFMRVARKRWRNPRDGVLPLYSGKGIVLPDAGMWEVPASDD